MKEKIELLTEYIKSSKSIVFFGGAGVSTASGIPDFRSVDGLYQQKYRYSPEEILSHKFFFNNPFEFYRFYFDKMIYSEAKPNSTHIVLARIGEMGKKITIVTQNIDNLHQLAGSNDVLELHGSVYRNYCVKCNKSYSLVEVQHFTDLPICSCGNLIKPDVTLYGEQLEPSVVSRAIKAIEEADLLIIGGTSLSVYPAASFIEYYRGQKSVLINKCSTHIDGKVTLLINDDITKVFESIILGTK